MASVEPTAKVGWEYKTLGEMCDIVNGATPKTKVAEYWEGSHQWITPAEMGNRETPYISNTNRTLTDSGLANCSASLLPAKSVILSSRAPIGHLVINDVPMAFNQGCKGLVPPKDLEYKFLYYFLFSSVELLNSLGTGATFKELSATKLKQVPFPLPPLSEQERIVGILDEAFEGIATATAQAEKNLHNARELFQSVLQSTFSQKGDDWVTCPLADLLELITYGFTNPMPTTDTGPYMVTAKNIREGRINYETTRHTSKEAFDELLTKKSRPKIGDILLTKDGTLGRLAVVDRENICVNQSVAVLRPNEKVEPNFLSLLLSSPSYQTRMIEDAGGTTIKHIYITRVDKMEVAYPPAPNDRQAIVEKLDALSEKTKALEAIYERKQSALAELKQSLLQKAFAGEL